MGDRGGNRIVFRIFLVALLIAAAVNMMYVYRFTEKVDIQTRETLAAAPVGTVGALVSPTRQVHAVRRRPSYPTDGWHGRVQARLHTDGSYEFQVSAGDYGRTLQLTSFEAWISKSGSSDEKKIDLQRDHTGAITTRITFPEKGDWSLRVRLTSGKNSLEFSERVNVK